MRPIVFLSSLALVVGFASSARAQDSVYVPPPLFDDQVRPHSDTGNLVEPRVSTMQETVPAAPVAAPAAPAAPQSVTAPAEQDKRPLIEERKSTRLSAPKKPEAEAPPAKQTKVSIPTPPKKPAAPVTTATKAAPLPPQPSAPEKEVPNAKAPASVEKKPTEVKKTSSEHHPASKVTSAGVVTGPVSMPSVPTQHVEAVEAIGDIAPSTGDDGLTIMERHQRQVKGEKIETSPKPEVQKTAAVTPDKKVTPAEFEAGNAQDVMKKILPFQPGQIILQETDVQAIGAGILEELEKRDHWRIQIRSYATPHGGGMNSDKRISLSRAIALRKALVDQGVRPSRIDVRAEGSAAMPEGASGDRIDLYLYKPTDKTIVF